MVGFAPTSSDAGYQFGLAESWDFGDGSSQFNDGTHTYSAPGIYNVTLTGTWTDTPTNSICVHTFTLPVTVGNLGYTLSGNVTLSAPPVNADDTLLTDSSALNVYLIKLDSTTNVLSEVATSYPPNQLLAGGSAYSFSNVTPGLYLVKAALFPYYTFTDTGTIHYVPTYGLNSLYWSNAASLIVVGANATDANIVLQQGVFTGGPGFVGGSVLQGANKGTSAGDPVPYMEILLRNTTTSEVINDVYTDQDGTYSFTNIPIGNYDVYPEALSYATTPFPSFTVTNSNPTINNVSFRQNPVDLTIVPITEAVTNVAATNNISVYPNPTTGQVSILWNETTAQNAHVSIADVTGRSLFDTDLKMNAGAGQQKLNLSDLTNGIYLISIKGNKVSYTQKLTVQK